MPPPLFNEIAMQTFLNVTLPFQNEPRVQMTDRICHLVSLFLSACSACAEKSAALGVGTMMTSDSNARRETNPFISVKKVTKPRLTSHENKKDDHLSLPRAQLESHSSQ